MSANSSGASVLLLLLATATAAAGQAPPAPEVSGPASSTGWSAVDLTVEAHGQSAQQLWADRYACDQWAKEQSGFDLTRPAAGVSGAGNASRRLAYRRAVTACLETKGYSVRDVTPSMPARPPWSTPPTNVGRESAPLSAPEHRPLTAQIEGGYTVTQDQIGAALHNGWNAGLGVTWSPDAALPLAFRADVSYSRFNETDASLRLASQRTGANITLGRESVYGGDVDVQLNLRMGPTVREYFIGGVGWYRAQTVFRRVSFESGVRCDFFCMSGFFPVASTVEQNTTRWLHSWNAGMGFEFALTPPGSLFIEARYLRIGPASNRMVFVPVRVGLRF